jgi:hypothetical protein
MGTVNISDDLLLRAQRLADEEGITVDAFADRIFEDAIVSMEQANAEINAVEAAMAEVSTGPMPGLGAYRRERAATRFGSEENQRKLKELQRLMRMA